MEKHTTQRGCSVGPRHLRWKPWEPIVCSRQRTSSCSSRVKDARTSSGPAPSYERMFIAPIFTSAACASVPCLEQMQRAGARAGPVLVNLLLPHVSCYELAQKSCLLVGDGAEEGRLISSTRAQMGSAVVAERSLSCSGTDMGKQSESFLLCGGGSASTEQAEDEVRL